MTGKQETGETELHNTSQKNHCFTTGRLEAGKPLFHVIHSYVYARVRKYI